MIVIIRKRKPQGCDLCDTVAELRPYGPNGEWICFECGTKNPEATKRQCKKMFIDQLLNNKKRKGEVDVIARTDQDR